MNNSSLRDSEPTMGSSENILIVNQYNSYPSMVAGALFEGFAFGLVLYYGLDMAGYLSNDSVRYVILIVAVLVSALVVSYKFMNAKVNRLTISEKGIEYRHMTRGGVVIDAISFDDIDKVYIGPSPRAGVLLTVSSKSGMKPIATPAYSLKQMLPVKERLKDYIVSDQIISRDDFTDDTSVNPWRVLKIIAVLAMIIVLAFIIGMWATVNPS